MKYLYVILLVVFLGSCFFSKDESVKDAKKELWVIKTETNHEMERWDLDVDINWKNEDISDDMVDSEINGSEIIKLSKYETEYLSNEKFLELNELDKSNFSSLEVELTWITLVDIDKIEVNFSNKDSKFPDDNYTLTEFKPWDKTFLYRAFSKYETFDYWRNVYTFIAYSWENKSILELVINNVKEEKKSIEDNNVKEKASVWEKELLDLSIFKDIEWLEVINEDTSFLTCENISDYLNENILSFKWWNTCRIIWNDEWLSVFVVRLSSSKYIYEKHYFVKWVYWIYELESWDIDDTEDDRLKFIKNKNTELKEKNEDYEKLSEIDKLFE